MKWSILLLIVIASHACLGRKTLQVIPETSEQLGLSFVNPIVGAGCCGVNPDNLEECCAQNPSGECCSPSPPALCIEQAQSNSGRIDGNTWVNCCYSKATQFFPRYDPSCPPPQCGLIGADARNYIICCSLKSAGQDATCPQPQPVPPPTPPPNPNPNPKPTEEDTDTASTPPEDESPCPSICSDIPPNSSYTCVQQVEFGKCGETWMVGKCDWSCGRCSCELAPAPETEN